MLEAAYREADVQFGAALILEDLADITMASREYLAVQHSGI